MRAMFPHTDARRAPLRTEIVLFRVAIGALVLLRLWLGSRLHVTPKVAPHDDLLFLDQAKALLDGQWLGKLDALTLIKGPFYPLFIAATQVAGIRLIAAEQWFYVASCGLFAVALTPCVLDRARRSDSSIPRRADGVGARVGLCAFRVLAHPRGGHLDRSISPCPRFDCSPAAARMAGSPGEDPASRRGHSGVPAGGVDRRRDRDQLPEVLRLRDDRVQHGLVLQCDAGPLPGEAAAGKAVLPASARGARTRLRGQPRLPRTPAVHRGPARRRVDPVRALRCPSNLRRPCG